MFDIIVGFIKSLINDSLFVVGVAGFIACWWMNFTNRLLSVIAIPAASVSLAFAAYVFADERATEQAKIQCVFLQKDAKAAGEKAAKEALQAIIDKQRQRMIVSELAAKRSKELAESFRSELQLAEQERANKEVKINELEKELPENPGCTTSDALRGELSD